jgi:hypothetical protein
MIYDAAVKRVSMAVWLVVAACSGGGGKATKDPGGEATREPDAADSAAPAEPKVETEHDKLLRFAKDKRMQCAKLQDVLQKKEMRADDIVKLEEKERIDALAKDHESIAAAVEAVHVTVADLGALRDKYTGMHKDMAAALGEASAAAKKPDQKKALDRYRKIDEDKKKVIDEINDWCAKPIEEPEP